MKLAVWLLERALEILAGTVLIMVVSAPSRVASDGSLVEEFLRSTLIPLTFYFISGYIASCLYFGCMIRTRRRLLPLLMGLVFSGHLLAIHLVSSAQGGVQIMVVAILAIACVLAIHAIGQFLFLKGTPQGEWQ